MQEKQQQQQHTLRLIIVDQEENLSWGDDISNEAALEVLIYIKDQIRKKYSVDAFAYKDLKGVSHELDKIVEFRINPVFILIPSKADVQTVIKDEPRIVNSSYSFKDPENVRIVKYENLKKSEEISMKLSVIKTLNNTNKNRSFETEARENLAKAQSRMANIANKALSYVNPFNLIKKGPEQPTNYKLPTFGQRDEDLIGSDLLDDDMSKRQKVHGNDGISQWEYIKMVNAQREQASVPQGNLQQYTLEDVKKHNKREDAWMIVDGKVYDVTNYIPFHPGGNKILAGIGRDGTELFNRYHPWVNASNLIGKNLIGFLKK